MSRSSTPSKKRQIKYPHYEHIPSLRRARFVFIEEALWAAGVNYARARRYESKQAYDLNVLCGVTRLASLKATVVRTATDNSVVVTATAKYLQSVGQKRGNLIRISMSDIRRAERFVEWRNATRIKIPQEFAMFG